MFQTVRYRLLLSYLTVLMLILGSFAIAVRITFARTLNLQLNNRLEVLATAAALNLEIADEDEDSEEEAEDARNVVGELEIDHDEILVNGKQGIQWFDVDGNLLGTQGDYPLVLPFSSEPGFQVQMTPYPARGITIPVNDLDTGEFIGYARVSESTRAYLDTLRNLDLGLGIGVVMALVLSGLGGVWLTNQAMHPIEKSFRRLQQFTADASHELRNPLMAIKSNTAVALKYPDGMRDLDAEKFRAIASAATQMTALTEDLLLLARTDQALAQTHHPVNLSTLLQNLVQLYRAEAEVKQIQLTAQIQEDLQLLGNAVQLNRLFTNLISNSLRYTPGQGAIAIQADGENGRILVTVKDNGVGIAPDHLEHIFDRFWRADRSRSYGSGFGLGLAIAQNIARTHAGLITVTSEVGVGSCFTVQFPEIPRKHRQFDNGERSLNPVSRTIAD